jgi:hypothetical protein
LKLKGGGAGIAGVVGVAGVAGVKSGPIRGFD